MVGEYGGFSVDRQSVGVERDRQTLDWEVFVRIHFDDCCGDPLILIRSRGV